MGVVAGSLGGNNSNGIEGQVKASWGAGSAGGGSTPPLPPAGLAKRPLGGMPVAKGQLF